MHGLTWTVSLVLLLAGSACNDGDGGADGGGKKDNRPGTDASGEGKGCAELSSKAELPPLDMLIALDTSFSMDFSQKWDSVKAALKQFVVDPRFAQLGVGLQFFPLRAQCKVEDYAVPAVPIAPLPTSGPQISAALDAQQMSGGTPMVPMLQGAITYCRQWATQNTGRKLVVVVATDGIPDDTCLMGVLPNTIANVVAVAADGIATKPAVPTFVIGVGKELTALDQIAQAGGTVSAFLIDPTKDLQQAFLTALDDIRRDIACEYPIPPPPSSEIAIDYAKVQVRYTSAGKAETLTPVKDAADCASAPDKGWYYDSSSGKPTKIILCPLTCKRAQSSNTGQVDVVFGCRPTPA